MIPLDVERESTLENFKGYSARRKTGTTTVVFADEVSNAGTEERKPRREIPSY